MEKGENWKKQEVRKSYKKNRKLGNQQKLKIGNSGK